MSRWITPGLRSVGPRRTQGLAPARRTVLRAYATPGAVLPRSRPQIRRVGIVSKLPNHTALYIMRRMACCSPDVWSGPLPFPLWWVHGPYGGIHRNEIRHRALLVQRRDHFAGSRFGRPRILARHQAPVDDDMRI